MSLVLSFNTSAYAQCRRVYVIALCVCIITLFCALFLVKKVPKALRPVMYLFEVSVSGSLLREERGGRLTFRSGRVTEDKKRDRETAPLSRFIL